MQITFNLNEPVRSATGTEVRNGADLSSIGRMAVIAASKIRGGPVPEDMPEAGIPESPDALFDWLTKVAQVPVITIGDALLYAVEYIETDDKGNPKATEDRTTRRLRSKYRKMVRDADEYLTCSETDAEALLKYAEKRWAKGGADFVILCAVTDAVEDAIEAAKLEDAKAKAATTEPKAESEAAE